MTHCLRWLKNLRYLSYTADFSRFSIEWEISSDNFIVFSSKFKVTIICVGMKLQNITSTQFDQHLPAMRYMVMLANLFPSSMYTAITVRPPSWKQNRRIVNDWKLAYCNDERRSRMQTMGKPVNRKEIKQIKHIIDDLFDKNRKCKMLSK